ncbi:MAG: hypothetical protein ABI042_20220 [Verrucomicrobiota bacterium]
MKTGKTYFVALATLLGAVLSAHAAQSERIINIALSGYTQSKNPKGDAQAIPFRKTTKDFLEEISLVKSQDFTNGILVMVDHPDDTNSLPQIFARKGATQTDVTDLFTITQADNYVVTSKYPSGAFRSAAYYAIDHFRFNSFNADPNGVDLTLKVFSKETQLASSKMISSVKTPVTTTAIRSDGVGEMRSAGVFVAPIKGFVTIGAPKFLP